MPERIVNSCRTAPTGQRKTLIGSTHSVNDTRSSVCWRTPMVPCNVFVQCAAEKQFFGLHPDCDPDEALLDAHALRECGPLFLAKPNKTCRKGILCKRCGLKLVKLLMKSPPFLQRPWIYQLCKLSMVSAYGHQSHHPEHHPQLATCQRIGAGQR